MINIHNFGTIFGTILPRFRLTKVEKKQNGCQIKMAAKINIFKKLCKNIGKI